MYLEDDGVSIQSFISMKEKPHNGASVLTLSVDFVYIHFGVGHCWHFRCIKNVLFINDSNFLKAFV